MKAILNNENIAIAITENESLFPNFQAIEINKSQEDFINTAKLPKYENNNFIDAYVEVAIVPTEISRMKFIIQIKRSTGIKFEEIEIFINNIPNQYLDPDKKYEIITRLNAAVSFNRYNEDLLTIAQMMGITSEQLDEIFINGNLLN